MKTSFKAFNNIINTINQSAGNNQRDRGTFFEELVKIYLQNEPVYKNLYSDVWLLKEIPEKYGIPKQDTGVDLVAKNRITGKLTAIQAKFYQGKIGKAEINSFIAELGKSYYSDGLIVSTTDEWNQNALNTIEKQTKQVQRIGLSNLRHSSIDWSIFDFEKPKEVVVDSPKKLRDYQEEAIRLAKKYYKNNDRGMLVMAPGTGKTFTSLKIAESFAKDSGKKIYNILYLVPSIQLLTQTLFSWNTDKSINFNINSFAVTSDRKATKKKTDSDDLDVLAIDIGFPATTNEKEILSNYNSIKYDNEKITMNVIFSTYQSIDVVKKAQDLGYPKFDFIICDEAHRTTGITEEGKKSSHFTKVHNNNYINGEIRLYQTATPKIYSDDAKSKKNENSIIISSMDNEEIYGKEIFRLGFGEAVARGYLTDYKVMVLTVEEEAMTRNLQQTLADENGLRMNDIGKIIGIWNGMIKRQGTSGKVNGRPMKRAISFIDSIENSKKIAEKFNSVVNEYLGDTAKESFQIDVRHVDGKLNALRKKEALDWLTDDIDNNEARVLSNVKFLTEGIDVPNLDAVIFFAPKKSQVDIVQAVGRIMRKSKEKEYGYIILPIVIPAGTNPENILDDNKSYAAVWQILNALRSTDERFNAIVNQLQLNKEKSGNIDIINPGKGRPRKPYKEGEENGNLDVNKPIQQELELWDDIKEVIYGKIVRKVGNRRYLEDWSKDVNEIAQRYIRWITDRINDKENPIKNEFSKFVYSLQINLNKSITIELAIEMLAQHLITKPVFEALFDQNSFVNNNPVSQSMEKVVKELQKAGFEKEQDRLKPFYESVKLRASGIDNAESKQKLITTLYEKFFSTGFKTTSKRLGIIFTPVEVVDFIIKSVDEILQNHFEKSLSSKGVHILDPFTGTGTFVARVLSYLKSQMEQNKISMADIVHKYTKELHANEIILLSYYIAAINIETTFNEIDTNLEYQPFEGIVLTDTFESTENDNTFDDIFFGINNKRLKQQKKLPITAIIGNPPYKKIKATANDFTAVQNYPMLDGKINETYARETSANLKNSLQDSYIRALRWSTDRIGDTGIIGFITNNGYIDSASLNGVRKVLEKDFNYIYVINLKGSLSGLSSEAIKREGKNIFDIKTGVAIIILVKDGSNAHSIKYYDIGNNLSKQEKLDILSNNSIKDLDFIDIIPDENGDWINHRDKNYGKYLALGGEKDAVFQNKLVGFNTNRDFWSFNFSKKEVEKNIERMISNYNTEIEKSNDYDTQEEKLKNLNSNESYIKWSQGLKDKFIKSEKLNFKPNKIILTQAKPFTKKYVYYDRDLVERPGKFDSVLEENGEVIYTPGPGGARTFSALVGKGPINLQAFGYASKTQTYPIKVKTQGFEEDNFSNVTEKAKARFGLNDEEVIYYIYAVMHHQSFITRYEDDLRKIIPRIPLLKNVKKFVNIGKKLLDLHLNYEAVAPCENVKIKIKSENPDYTVKKMKHPKILNSEGENVNDLTRIIYNTEIEIIDIPEKAYNYVINGKSAINWIMSEYQIKTNKASGITDNPNDFSEDSKYILNLLLSVINLSLKTLDLIDSLPELELDE